MYSEYTTIRCYKVVDSVGAEGIKCILNAFMDFARLVSNSRRKFQCGRQLFQLLCAARHNPIYLSDIPLVMEIQKKDFDRVKLVV